MFWSSSPRWLVLVLVLIREQTLVLVSLILTVLLPPACRDLSPNPSPGPEGPIQGLQGRQLPADG